MQSIRVAELRGFKSLRALNVFHTLMLGLKMLPAYVGEHYEDFFERVQNMDAASQEAMLREAASFVELQKEEVEAVMSFCLDPNGVPRSTENMKNMPPDEIFECIVAVMKEIARIKITLVSEGEKKNYRGSR